MRALLSGVLSLLVLVPSLPAAPTALDNVENSGLYVGDLKNKALVVSDVEDQYDIGELSDRDALRRVVAATTIEYANEFVKSFDAYAMGDRLREIFPDEYVNDIPAQVQSFIGSLDLIDIDDYFAAVDNDGEKDKLDRVKMAFVVKSLFEYNPPPGGEGGRGNLQDEEVPTVDAGADSLGGEAFLAAMEAYDAARAVHYKYQVPQPHGTDAERDAAGGGGAILERTDDGGSAIARMQEIGQMVNGLDNSRTSNWWRNLQASGVEQCAEGESSEDGYMGSPAFEGEDGIWWRVKPGWRWHRHEDGTVCSYAQPRSADMDPYRPPALVSGAQLLSTELKMFDSGNILAVRLERFRQLVCNAEQKILCVDYEHFPRGMTPGRISEGIWGHGENGNPIAVQWFDEELVTAEQMADGIRFDWHTLPDGTQAPQPQEDIVASDHPDGNTAEGTGHMDLMVVRAVYWKDLEIPIYEYNLSYLDGNGDEETAPRVRTADVVLKMEKEVDAYDVPPDLVEYVIPPLLEAQRPGPTTFTRAEYPLGVSYGGTGGR